MRLCLALVQTFINITQFWCKQIKLYNSNVKFPQSLCWSDLGLNKLGG